MRHLSVARHVTQILHNEEVRPAEVELLMSELNHVLVKKEKVRAFVSLVQTIEDRLDPQSKYHDKTIDRAKYIFYYVIVTNIMGLLKGIEILLWVIGGFYAFAVFGHTNSNIGGESGFGPHYNSEFWVAFIGGTILFGVPVNWINRKLSSDPQAFDL